ncbi:MAG: transketolase [Lawsonibacter sp.]|nr:transketolase [Lawsonibacter sp.]
MSLSKERAQELTGQCAEFRRALIRQLHAIQTGHPGGSLSCCEILTVLYQEKMQIDPANPAMENRDYFVLSKGHAAPMLYLNLAEKGFFPKEELTHLRQIDSMLQGHPCAHKIPGVELSTGPLGLGLGAALGMALAERPKGNDNYVYTLLGDGETDEGVIWEAAMSAAKYGADNLVAILDNNGVQLDGTVDEIMPLGDVAAKWASFGWRVLRCDGHDVTSVADAIDEAKQKTGKPTIIIAKTIKGKGVSFMEGKNIWHGKAIDDDSYVKAMAELGGEA